MCLERLDGFGRLGRCHHNGGSAARAEHLARHKALCIDRCAHLEFLAANHQLVSWVQVGQVAGRVLVRFAQQLGLHVEELHDAPLHGNHAVLEHLVLLGTAFCVHGAPVALGERLVGRRLVGQQRFALGRGGTRVGARPLLVADPEKLALLVKRGRTRGHAFGGALGREGLLLERARKSPGRRGGRRGARLNVRLLGGCHVRLLGWRGVRRGAALRHRFGKRTFLSRQHRSSG